MKFQAVYSHRNVSKIVSEQPHVEASERVGITYTQLEMNVDKSYRANLVNVSPIDVMMHSCQLTIFATFLLEPFIRGTKDGFSSCVSRRN